MSRRLSKFSISNFSYKTLFIIVFFLLIAIVSLLKFSTSHKISAAWFNEAWMYRQAINISSHSTSESNVYITVTINLSSTSKSQTDNGDFRFVSQSGQILPYFVFSGAGTINPVFHIKLDSFPSGAQTIYAYYGNPSAQNGFSTVDFSTQATSYTIGSYSNEEIGGGPVAYWKFDEGVGTTTFDSSSNQNNGSITGATWQSDDQCISGKCLYFNGSSYVNTNFGLGRDISINPLSISMWVKPTTPIGNYIFLSPNQGTNQRFYFGTYNGKWDMGVQNAGWGSGTVNVEVNTWNHVEIVTNGSTVYMYVNGKIVKQSNYSSFTLPENIRIGTHGSAGSYGFYGYIDDIKIYPYARTADQIKSDYAAGKAHASSSNGSSANLGGNKNSGEYLSEGLIGYWKIDEGVGTTTIDNSGNSNTATIIGAGWSSGKYGNSASFIKESSQRIDVSNESYFDLQSDLTISTWVNISSHDNFGGIVSKTDSNTNGWEIRTTSVQGGIQCRILNGSDVGPSTTITLNQWHHLVCSYSAQDNIIKLYVDGIIKDSVPGNNGISTNNRMLTIGALAYANTLGVTGSIDEVRIYNRALSSSEVSDLYNWNPNGVAKKTPIAHWKFDEGFGTTTNNSSSTGSSLNGTFGTGNSTPTWTNNGKFGTAISFDGTGDYINVNDTPSLSPANISISTWIKWNGIRYSPASLNDWAAIISKGNYNAGEYVILMSRSTNESTNTFNFYINATNPVSWTSSNLDTNWHLLTATFNGSVAKIYFDGIQKASNNASPTIPDTSDPVKIGAQAANNYPWGGQLDDIRIYNSALTDDEVKLDYNQGSAISFGSSNQTIGNTITSLDYCIPGDTSPCSSPVAEWKMDERVGSSVVDISGNNNTGTTYGTTWTKGKIGSSLLFDGFDDYTSVNSNSHLNLNTSFTIEGWYKINSFVHTYPGIITKGNSSTSDGYLIFYVSNGTTYFKRNNQTYSLFNNSENNTWKYFAITYDLSTQTLKSFLNGNNTSTNTGVTFPTNNGTDNLLLGRGDEFGNEYLDHIKIYDYARTPAQIAYDYNKGAPGGWWKFDECQGNISKDSSGIGNTGSISINSSGTQTSVGTCTTSGTAWGNGASGKFNSSLNFDGTDDVVNLGNPSSLNFGTDSFSYGLWVYVPSSAGPYDMPIWKGGSSAANAGYDMELGTDGWGAGVGDGTRNFYSGFGSETLNQWTHLFVVVDRQNNQFRTYKNTQLIQTVNISTLGSTSSSNHLTISSSSYPFKGKLDDVRIYNYALTPSQIKTVYNNGAITFN